MKIPSLREFHAHNRFWVMEVLKQFVTHSDKKCWIKMPPHEKKTVALVAHIDTVHERGVYTRQKWNPVSYKMEDMEPEQKDINEVKEIFFDREKAILWSPEGLGADDRAGVYGIIRAYETLPNDLKPILIFCDEEESGGDGARQVYDVYQDLIDDCLFFLEIDRRNGNDCVFYNDEPEPFVKFIESFGFVRERGSFSDISILGRKTKKCGANLSAGYYHEHTKTEYLRITQLADTVTKACNIVMKAVQDQMAFPNPNAKDFAPVKTYGYGGMDHEYESEGLWGRQWSENWKWDSKTRSYIFVGKKDDNNGNGNGSNGKAGKSEATPPVERRDASLVGLKANDYSNLTRKERRRLRREQQIAELQRKADTLRSKHGVICTPEELARRPHLAELVNVDRGGFKGGP